ncbi:hypothetical protein [Natrarchaeobaculum aegyptiacum]|uniref:Uncharacterized protein n=1 Tax=Natrarchaeobaculum aegyptiacum TaxID=745377 RepID=A0A2Z2HSP9_9EURY|nr:hypothetical protein [Natrarchaeobaculum aegyptiacum]ARS89783.1 hypothetical protein B1756_08550 [Natrarchaeobaculum aegyptiacum]
MPTDQHPLPREALPPGWGPAECGDCRFVYHYRQPPIELVADRTGARCHPSLGLDCCWELRCRCAVDDRSLSHVIGHVSNRFAAADGLLECMRRIHETVDEASDPLYVLSVVNDVSLSDAVPNGPVP